MGDSVSNPYDALLADFADLGHRFQRRRPVPPTELQQLSHGEAYVLMMVVRTSLMAREIWRNAALLVPLRLGANLMFLSLDIVVLAIGTLLLPWTLFLLPLFGLSLMGLAGVVVAMEGIKTFVIQDTQSARIC